MTQSRRGLYTVVVNQFPESVRDRFTRVELEADAFHLRCKVIITTPNGHKWETHLEAGDIQGVDVHYVVPQDFIAKMCLAT